MTFSGSRPGGPEGALAPGTGDFSELLRRSGNSPAALENSGDMKRLIGEAEIIHAVQHPPSSSRAYLRGRSVLKFAREMKTAQWDNLVFKVGDQMYRLDMSQAFPGLRLEEMIVAMDKSKTIHDLIRELNLKPV